MRRWALMLASVALVGGCGRGGGDRGGGPPPSNGAVDAALGADEPQPHALSAAETCIALYLQQQKAADRSLNIAAPEAERLVREIISKTGAKTSPVVIPCDQADQAFAWVEPYDVADERGRVVAAAGEYIIYNPRWTLQVIGEDRGQAVALFGHEIGHLLNRDFGPSRVNLPVVTLETDADEFAGCALAKQGQEFAPAEALLKRLRDEQAIDHPNRLESMDVARRGFVACGGNADQLCRIPENGIERWHHETIERGDSSWRGGGGSADRYCGEFQEAIRARYSTPVTLDVVGSGEQSRSSCNPFNCTQYQYYCIVKIKRDPVYNEARSKSCPASASTQ